MKHHHHDQPTIVYCFYLVCKSIEQLSTEFELLTILIIVIGIFIGSYLAQRLSLAIQRGNVASRLGTLLRGSDDLGTCFIKDFL